MKAEVGQVVYVLRLDKCSCGMRTGISYQEGRLYFVEWRQSKLTGSVSIVILFFFCIDFNFSHIACGELIWSLKSSHIILGYVHILYPLQCVAHCWSHKYFLISPN